MEKHSFEIEMAKDLGISAAVVYDRIYDLCQEQARNGTDYHDGLFWVRMPYKAFRKFFPYMATDTVSRAIKKLNNEGLIMTGHYGGKYDNSNWYAAT